MRQNEDHRKVWRTGLVIHALVLTASRANCSQMMFLRSCHHSTKLMQLIIAGQLLINQLLFSHTSESIELNIQ